MTKDDPKPVDPTQDPEFKRVLGNLLNTPHKPQSELRAGRSKGGGAKVDKVRSRAPRPR